MSTDDISVAKRISLGGQTSTDFSPLGKMIMIGRVLSHKLRSVFWVVLCEKRCIGQTFDEGEKLNPKNILTCCRSKPDFRLYPRGFVENVTY